MIVDDAELPIGRLVDGVEMISCAEHRGLIAAERERCAKIADGFAEKIAKNAPLVIQAMKAIALGSVPKGPMELNYRVNRMLAGIAASEDGQEGIASFRDKRQAAFKGR